jgi:CRP-like cAMP-binding protein
METIDALLARHSFFEGLKKEYLELISGCGRNVHFDANQYLLREGENADQFYAIRSGSVSVEIHAPQRGAVTLQTVEAGEILGWSWLFPPYKWQFDARARESVSATVFDAECLRNKCDGDPALGYELMKRLARIVTARLEATRLQLLDIYGPGSGG